MWGDVRLQNGDSVKGCTHFRYCVRTYRNEIYKNEKAKEHFEKLIINQFVNQSINLKFLLPRTNRSKICKSINEKGKEQIEE